MAEFRMPFLGAEMDTGTLVRWLVKPGDVLKRGDLIAEVETDKADIEVEVFEEGVVEALLAREGETIAAGAVIATLARPTDAGKPPETPAMPAAPPLTTAVPSASPAPRMEPAWPTPAAGVTVPAHGPQPRATPVAKEVAQALRVDLSRVKGTGIEGRITRADVEAFARLASPRASPLARRLAREQGIDISHLAGSGPGGAVVARDVVVAPPQPASPVVARPARDEEGSRERAMRRAIAAAMERSHREVPHYYLGTEVDMSRALAWLEAYNEAHPVTERVLYPALLIKAVALAVPSTPSMNGFWTDGEFHPSSDVHVGVAVSLRTGGLVAPAIQDVPAKSLQEVMAALKDLVARARQGKLRSSEVASPTITVTNLGERGVSTVYGVIYQPQVALVGFGRIVERAWVDAGVIGPRPILTATLSADHRASDGHDGARFLETISRLLQDPEKL
jgi:pyruvate dehydrogenase E2 component (dihydrolipoamide acetyltransferase)